MKIWRYLSVLLFGLLFTMSSFGGATVSANEKIVYHVPIEETVEKGLSAFLERALTTAEAADADLVVFEVNTPGGAVDAAGEIAKLLADSPIKTVAYVNNRALSAGAYISLSADEIYMVPSATMGSAAVIDSTGNAASKKAQSYWLAAMKTAAEQNGRDPIYAQAMADVDIDLPEYGAEKGKLLTFTAEQAKKAGYSEGTVSGKAELYSILGVEDADIRSIEESFPEKLARFLTNPIVVPILLTIAGIGIVMELFSPGFGIPGVIGITSLVLFFYGHLVAGITGYESLALFIIGVILVLIEFFIPGGIIGLLGFTAVVGSLFLATGDPVHMTISLLIAVTVSILVFILLVKVFGKQMKFFRKMILTDATKTEQGYVSNPNRLDLLGVEGKALTDLRPSGTALVKEERVDVVTEGSFISKGSSIIIVKVEGSRVVVREIPDSN
ncbi:nodulation protein NfeD [Peribacillus sp. FSL K6-5616]|uniref:Membrane bound hydrolase n=1 Tax=Peribacillus simplex TaxID=1478 RepID=A0AAN2PL96_9BACI|nr:nodulation protein NfeD [Peribacillus simplex]MCP1092607.1 nodulation protein NfeD [Bacillaceae bacterium OS4b]CEG33725.1 putative membrane bound hydrolase [Peribacillus simplex]